MSTDRTHEAADTRHEMSESKGPKGARGRRFEEALDPTAAALNASVEFDRRLLVHDVAGSIAHAEMLATRGLITAEDRDADRKSVV